MYPRRLVRRGHVLLAVAALLVLAAGRPAHAQAPSLLRSWPVTELNGPLAVTPSGTLLLGHQRGAAVETFTRDGASLGSFLACMCGGAHTPVPNGLAVDASGNIYYGDAANKRIMKFDPAGNLITSWGSPGAGDGQFGTIGGVAVDAAGTVFVLDKSNSRVQKFTSDGAFVGKFGSLGRGAGQFLLPEALALDADGNVYVAEQGTERVQKLTSDGALIRTLVAPGIYWGPANPVPLSLAVDRSGFVYVTGGPLLAVIAPSGVVLGTWDSPEARGMVLDDAQNLYVSDYYGNQIVKYGPAPTAVSTSTWGALKSIYR